MNCRWCDVEGLVTTRQLPYRVKFVYLRVHLWSEMRRRSIPGVRYASLIIGRKCDVALLTQFSSIAQLFLTEQMFLIVRVRQETNYASSDENRVFIRSRRIVDRLRYFRLTFDRSVKVSTVSTRLSALTRLWIRLNRIGYFISRLRGWSKARIQPDWSTIDHQRTEKIPKIKFSTKTRICTTFEIIVDSTIFFASFRVQQFFRIDQIRTVGHVRWTNTLKLNEWKSFHFVFHSPAPTDEPIRDKFDRRRRSMHCLSASNDRADLKDGPVALPFLNLWIDYLRARVKYLLKVRRFVSARHLLEYSMFSSHFDRPRQTIDDLPFLRLNHQGLRVVLSPNFRSSVALRRTVRTEHSAVRSPSRSSSASISLHRTFRTMRHEISSLYSVMTCHWHLFETMVFDECVPMDVYCDWSNSKDLLKTIVSLCEACWSLDRTSDWVIRRLRINVARRDVSFVGNDHQRDLPANEETRCRIRVYVCVFSKSRRWKKRTWRSAGSLPWNAVSLNSGELSYLILTRSSDHRSRRESMRLKVEVFRPWTPSHMMRRQMMLADDARMTRTFLFTTPNADLEMNRKTVDWLIDQWEGEKER